MKERRNFDLTLYPLMKQFDLTYVKERLVIRFLWWSWRGCGWRHGNYFSQICVVIDRVKSIRYRHNSRITTTIMR